MNGKMKIIDFNQNFNGFYDSEDILLDTGVILALLNQYDAWHATVRNLFNSYVFNSMVNLSLYIHPGIVNEVTHLSGKPLEQYMTKHQQLSFSRSDIEIITTDTLQKIRDFIDQEILIVLEGNKKILLRQIDHCRYFGAMDSMTVAMSHEYGISLLTVDNKLVNNIAAKANEFNDIARVYHTTPAYRSY